jgi:hypothetical protein
MILLIVRFIFISGASEVFQKQLFQKQIVFHYKVMEDFTQKPKRIDLLFR